MSSQHGERRPTNGWDRLVGLGHSSKFQRNEVSTGFALLHRRHSTEVNQTLHNVWPSVGPVHYIHIFGGSCPLTESCKVQNSLCVQVLRSAMLAALLHDTRVVGVSQTLQQRAPPIFGRAAITLGIGPHSSLLLLLHALWYTRSLM